MNRSRGIVFSMALLLALITISAALNQQQPIAPKKVSVNDLKVMITTTKSVYNVGEVINGTIWLVNETPQPVQLDPIYTFYLTAGYAPFIYGTVGHISPASPDAVIEIPAWGRVSFLPLRYSAGQVGTFEIRAYGASAKVEVIN